jgi:hypothetical protein
MLAFEGERPFSLAAHPGYTPRHVETNTSFAVDAATTFTFVHAETIVDAAGEGKDGREEASGVGSCVEAEREQPEGVEPLAKRRRRQPNPNSEFGCAICRVANCGNAPALAQVRAELTRLRCLPPLFAPMLARAPWSHLGACVYMYVSTMQAAATAAWRRWRNNGESSCPRNISSSSHSRSRE